MALILFFTNYNNFLCPQTPLMLAFRDTTHERPRRTWGGTEDARQQRHWHSFVSLTTKSPPPQPALKRRCGVSLWFPPHSGVRARLASSPAAFTRRPATSQLETSSNFPRVTSTTGRLWGPNMTFRRLKKVNSSGPESGAPAQDSDIYFPSSKSDSYRSMDLPTNSSDVYNYKTLAYSGGTLPRTLKKVRSPRKTLLVHNWTKDIWCPRYLIPLVSFLSRFIPRMVNFIPGFGNF